MQSYARIARRDRGNTAHPQLQLTPSYGPAPESLTD